ncbi:ATP-binding protein [Amphritea atlantica]|nr:ATP-binding protein [Amphritea atlantica]
MRIGITGKMVLVMLAASVLLVAAMAVAMRLSFQKGFDEYLSEVEMGRLDQTVEDLSNAYRREGSWNFIEGNHRLWMTFMPSSSDASVNDGDAVVAAPSSSRAPQPFTARSAPLAPADKTGISTRLRLLNADKQRLIGPPDTSGLAVNRPISLDGELIGWLSLTPQAVPSSRLDKAFRDEQLNAIYPIGLGALLLALLVGIPMGRYLLRPVKAVARGAHVLAKGEFDIRLDIHSRDELGQLAQDFNMLAGVLQRNELLRRRGMADISHELRTPLALLRGEIEAMQDGIRPVDQPQLGKLHDANMQLSHLVDDLYDLALTDAGALSYKKQLFNLVDTLEGAVAAAEHSFSQSQLSLTLTVPESLTVLGDPRRLRQVMDNLLKNSRRYTDAGGQTVVSASRLSGNAVIRVEDSAPTVDTQMLERLFDRFYRVDESRSRASGGAGLGLAICRNIVDAHQGEISAAVSELGGLAVEVVIPLADDN